jgi:hypothetical protein
MYFHRCATEVLYPLSVYKKINIFGVVSAESAKVPP